MTDQVPEDKQEENGALEDAIAKNLEMLEAEKQREAALKQAHEENKQRIRETVDLCNRRIEEIDAKLKSLQKEKEEYVLKREELCQALGDVNPTKVSEPQTGLENRRVLVVDDVYSNLMMLSRLLMRFGMEVESCMSADEALKKLQNSEPVDLVITDIKMPDMTGLEFVEVLRKIPAVRDVPVIFCTASEDRTHVLKAVKLGAVEYILKPYDKDTIRQKVEGALQKAAEKKQ